jgi:hypothetical protein
VRRKSGREIPAYNTPFRPQQSYNPARILFLSRELSLKELSMSTGTFFAIVTILLASSKQGYAAPPHVSESQGLHPVVSIAQELLDTMPTGDTLVWKKHLLDSCIIAIEDGSSITKQYLVAETRPLPAGYTGYIKLLEPQWREYGDVVVLTFVADEYMTILGHDIHTQYRETGTFLRQEEGWKLASMHVMEIPKNPAPAQVPDTMLKRLTGRYRLGGGVEYSVSLRDGRLFGERTGRRQEELFAESETIFFTANPRMRKVFVLGDTGVPSRMIDRRAGIDLVWERVP